MHIEQLTRPNRKKRVVLFFIIIFIAFFLVHLASPRSFEERIYTYEYHKSWGGNLILVTLYIISLDLSFKRLFLSDRNHTLFLFIISSIAVLSVIPIIIFYFLFIQNWDLSGSIFHTDIPVSMLLALLASLGFYFYYNFLHFTSSNKEDLSIKKLSVYYGQATTTILTNEISYIYLENKLIHIVTNDQTFHCSLSLTELEEMVSNLDFYRANRQLLLTKQSVLRYEKAGNRKLNIYLNGREKSPFIVSKEKVTSFKKWLTI